MTKKRTDYTIKQIPSEEFHPIWREHKQAVFEDNHTYDLWGLLSEEELEKVNALRARLKDKIEICLGVFDQDDNFVGWSWGFQDSSTSFYMANSGILEGHRRIGLYSKLLDEMLRLTCEYGFQIIHSKHCATNNAVIIPKLKADFVISKMEIDDIFGVLIHLHFYVNPTRRKMMDYRSGQKKPDQEIKMLLEV